jgi:hypothetical protein
MCSVCIVVQHVCVGNINIEHAAMDTQQYILFSIVVELNIFFYNKMYLHLKIKYVIFCHILSKFGVLWQILIKAASIRFHENLSSGS